MSQFTNRTELDARTWDFSCPDWMDRLRDGRSLVPDLPLNQVEADRAVGVFNKLCLPDVPGTPAMAEAAGDWFRDIVAALFGSMQDDGRRGVGEIFGLVPKKNSKTTGGAGIMVTALILNKRPKAEFLLVGPTQDIADLAFQQAKGMIEGDPEGYLQKRFIPRDHLKTIVDLTNGSTLKIKTFDMSVMTGAKPTGVLVDEIHVMSKFSYASRVIGQIRGGLDPRPDGFLIFITTQSDEPPAGCFKAELGLARGIRDGRVRGDAAKMLPVLYEFPESMQVDPKKPWADPDNWHMVLPNLGLSITLQRLKETFAAAMEKGEEEVRRWASQHLNVEIGLALHSDRWTGADHWLKASRPNIVTLAQLMARCEVIVVGIDGGGLDDLMGLGAIGRDKVTREWLGWCRAWAYPEVLDRRKDIAEKLRELHQLNELVLCTEPDQDLREIADIVMELREAGLMPEKDGIGLDPQSIGALIDELVSREIRDDEMVGIAQGYRLSGAVWTIERKLKHGSFLHGGQELMNWCVGNARCEQRGNAVLITKQAAGRAKIDPLIALFNAAMLMARNPVAASSSSFVYTGM